MKKILTFLLLVLNLQGIAQDYSIEFQDQNIPSTSTFRAIHVFNDSCIWLGGTHGNYCFTNNGGKEWKKAVVPGAEKLDFRDLHVFSKDHVVLMSCGNGLDSRIYVTKNGGESWSLSHQNTFEKAFYNGIDFWDEQNGILTSDAIDSKPYILITENAGESWDRLKPQFIPDLKEGEYAFAASGTGIVTRGVGEVWIATGGMHSRIFYSADKGQNWEVFETPIIQGTSTEGIYSFFIDDKNRAVCVGGNYKEINECKGNVILSTDSGKSWKLADGEESVAFKECVHQLEKNVWIATGPSGTAISRDNGENWKEIDKRAFHTMDYDAKSKTGFLAGDQGLVVKFHLKNKEL
ncbi:WD40/YVTN/BNR-like repeat-containing protein [Marinifilum caeruleilacunae]|uniref:Oxidoreductase n=1 Tax=Marinifilum caeruleilacunae TaxID=2499076 RepID=A0ABX1WSR7_9BACT|nr:hypothetical protein [Marinifilum caeruleilacunae]NOU59118.1 hypothetical protein [Marinifilum caeruleilacunae]